jgi:hypothetical protein
MATVHKEILIDTPAQAAWDAARDVGALHTRLVPGFVADTQMEPGAEPPVRIVRFASGLVVRETIVEVDEAGRRVVWAVSGEGVDHHNGALQLHEAGPGRTRAVWIADVLPHALAERFAPMMEQGLAAMKRRLEADAG